MFAGIACDGSLVVVDGLSLETVTKYSPDITKSGAHLHSATFCSGLGSFCVCTDNGQLHFLHLGKKNASPEHSSSASVSQVSTVGRQANGKGQNFMVYVSSISLYVGSNNTFLRTVGFCEHCENN